MLSYQESEHVNLHFVVPKTNDTEIDEMKLAFEECVEAGLTPEWVTEEDCMQISCTKLDVFILKEFDGNIFNKLKSTRSVICGPICLRTCLKEGKTIPENNCPVFTTAFRDLCITASYTKPATKMKIKEKIGFMGGIYTSNLVEGTTHLVTNAVRSSKYEKATERGIPVMTEEWIDAVWKTSLTKNVQATDEEFFKYKCKVFQDLQLTASNLPKAEKDKVAKLVNENGGIYTPKLHQNTTSLLVVSEPHGDKYKFATSWNLPCVRPTWIMESIEKGYAVPTTKHLLSSEMRCSTPTLNDVGDCTLGTNDQLSMIGHESDRTHINETAISNVSTVSSTRATTRSQALQFTQPTLQVEVKKYKETLESINITITKRAGLFVDGCKIFLSGFIGQEIERLRRLLSLGGAIIFSELTETVSYVIVGEHVAADIKVISNMTKRPNVVSVEWLAASIKQKSPAPADKFSCLELMNIPVEPPSPLSQKGLQLLQPVELGLASNTSSRSNQSCLSTPQVSRKLFKDFVKPAEPKLSQNVDKPPNITTDSQSSYSQSQSQITDLFKDCTFRIEVEDEDLAEKIHKMITLCGGVVVGLGFNGVLDYAVVPLHGNLRNLSATENVTYLWLEDCYENEERLSVEYYHLPFTINHDKKPLTDCCLSISSYIGKEKVYLTLLGEAMGGIFQDVFARKCKEGVLASTHLICPMPTGSKYKAAIKWNIPAVTKEWLFVCVKNGVKMPEESYLVTEENNEELKPIDPSIVKTPEETNVQLPTTSHLLQNNYDQSLTEHQKKQSTSFELPRSTSESHINPAKSLCAEELPSNTNSPRFSQSFTKPPVASRSSIGNKITKLNEFPRSPFLMCNFGNDSMRNRFSSGGNKRKCSTPDFDSDVSPFHVDTPESPYGRVFGGTPSRSTKKRWKRFIDGLPDKKDTPPPIPPKEESPSMYDLRQEMWKKFFDFDPVESSSNGNQNVDVSSDVKNKKIQSPSINDKAELPCTSKSPVEERVTQHFEKLEKCLTNHSSKEDSSKASKALNGPGLVSTPQNSSSSDRKATKIGLVDSQPITIDWDDPIETAYKMSNMNIQKNPTQRKFLLGSDLEDVYKPIIEGLGGEVLNSPTFNISSTHIIVENPVRSEKLLCSLASGKWVLHVNYLHKCKEMEKWLPEEDFECGNPKSANNIPKFSGFSSLIANAAYKWRSTLEEGQGAYSGMKIAVMNFSTSKKKQYERLIVAGGGVVVSETCLNEATHCCLDPWTGSMPDFVKMFIKNKIPCVRPVFLGEYLYRHPKPSVRDHLLPILKDFYNDVNF